MAGWRTPSAPLDTTSALSHLIFEGTLDRFPRLKICLGHGGGYLPSYAPASDNSLRVRPDMDTGVKLKRSNGVSEADVLRHAGLHSRKRSAPAAEVGVSQLVIAPTSDPVAAESVDHVSRRRASPRRSAGRCSARPRRGCWGSNSSVLS